MASTLFDLSRITNYKKKKRKKKPTKSRKQRYADKLNDNLPLSEVWFQSKWIKDIIQDKLSLYQDKYNEPIGKYIPDVINRGYKYIIEIDGKIHDDLIIQWKDKQKDLYYIKQGFKVFRIKAYDEEAYKQILINILLVREQTTRQY